jgi:hypothetical protein
MTLGPDIEVRGWPSDVPWRRPARRRLPLVRLGSHLGLILHIAAGGQCSDGSIGLGAYLLNIGSSVVGGGIITPDDTDRATRSSLRRWARRHLLDTLRGQAPWGVTSASRFFDPRGGLFAKTAYSGRAWCVGADMGRTLSMAAEHWHPRGEPYRDGWVLWLPGWGRPHDRGRWKRVSPHRPCLYVTRRRVGWQVSFGVVEKGNGKWHMGSPWRGAFVDLLSLAYALDGDRSASYGEHRSNFGLDDSELPLAVPSDTRGARTLTATVRGLHEFAVCLDRHAAGWFPKTRVSK